MERGALEKIACRKTRYYIKITNENCNDYNNIENDIQRNFDFCLIKLIESKKSGVYEVIKLLVANGANPNTNNEEGIPALILAIKTGKPRTSKLLLEKGVDPDTKDINGDPAWMVAIQNENLEIAELLLEARLHKK